MDDFTLLLLCGEAEFKVEIGESSFMLYSLLNTLPFKSTSYTVIIDRKVKYRLSPKDAIVLKHLRRQLASAISARMRNKPMSETQSKWFRLGMEVLGAPREVES